MYFVFNRGIDSILTPKGWVDYEKLSDESISVIGLNENIDIKRIKVDVIDKYSNTMTRAISIIPEETLFYNKPKKINLTESERKPLISGAHQLIRLLMMRQAITINISDKYLASKTPVSKDPEDLLRIQNELEYKNDEFIEDVILSSRKNIEIYNKSKEIMLTYDDTLKDIEGQINDELHYIEFNDLDWIESYKIILNLRQLRIKRRKIKDCISVANIVMKTLNDKNIEEFADVLDKMENFSNRRYVIRSPENFKH